MSKKQEVDINIRIDLANLQATPSINHSFKKIETSLTVAQLGYLSKLLIDQGYLTNQSKTDILTSLAGNFSTKNMQEISLKSLKAKYYSADQSTKESIKNMLLNLLNNLDE
ncbi:MAG: hypothetical protein JXR10_17605 [Cyclobacteriaceae bacterium]